ncbi:MAG: PQQ-binding-like beta-propeller repeat protein [Fimbriimonadaceae bacterium]|nr:PQQ-binding-like beta-propeller repeat protein [Fimbriimonadaceae bacterium]QYK59342.1 MAG: PQQ-binding-like beta-propeller repeat protein [Fimbriimonadaceae bacterium]
MRWFGVYLVLLSLLLSNLSVTGQTLVWRATIESNGPSADQGGVLKTDAAGRVLSVGHKVVRGSADSAGDIQFIWRNGSVNLSGVYRSPSGQPVRLYDAGIDTKGGTYLLYRDLGLANYGLGLTLAKFSPATGRPLWTVSLAETAGGALVGGRMAIDSTDHIAIGTTDSSPVRPSRFRLARVTSDGRLLLNRLLDRSSNLFDQFSAIAVDTTGNVYLTGSAGPDPRTDRNAVSTTQILTYRVRATNASIFWTRPYPTFGAFSDMKLALDPFGDVIVGALRIDGTTLVTSFAALKLAGNGGTTLWHRTYSAPQGGDMTLTDMAVRADGSVVLAGDSSDPVTFNQGGLVVAWNRFGSPLWARNLPGSELWGPNDVTETWFNDRLAVDSAGHVYFGSTEIGFEVYGRLTSGLVLTRLNGATGEIVWRRPYRPNATGSQSTSAVVLAKGIPIIAGTIESGTIENPMIQHFVQGVQPSNGTSAWTSRSVVGVGPQSDRIEAIDVAANGNTAWAGSQGGAFAVGLVSPTGGRVWTFVFDDQEKFGPKSVFEGATQVRFDLEGHVVAFGQNRGVAVAVRLNRVNGTPLWTRSLETAPAGSLLVDKFGHILVGVTGSPPEVVKLHKVNGNIVWRRPFDASGTNEDLVAMAVGPNGEVYATGRSWDESLGPPHNPNMRFFTAKYDMQTGQRLWARVQSPPVTRDVRPTAIEVDRLGFVVVAGSWTTARGLDAVVLRYRASDGVPNWVVSRDIGNQDQFVTAMALSPDGQIFTAGTTTDPVSLLHRAWVAKMSPSGGQTLWQTLGPAYGMSARPSGIALAANGDVHVVGTTTPDRSSSQLFTTRLLGTTGAVSAGLLMPGAAIQPTGPSVRLLANGRLQIGATMIGAKGDSAATLMQFR